MSRGRTPQRSLQPVEAIRRAKRWSRRFDLLYARLDALVTPDNQLVDELRSHLIETARNMSLAIDSMHEPAEVE